MDLIKTTTIADLKRAIRQGRTVDIFGARMLPDTVFSDNSQLVDSLDAVLGGSADAYQLTENKTRTYTPPSEPYLTKDTVVGLWHFDSIVTAQFPDSSANDNDLSTINATLSGSGKWSDASDFNGTTASAAVTIASTEPIKKFAFVSAWLKPDSVTDNRPICKFDDGFTLYLDAGVLKVSITDGVTPEIVNSSLSVSTGSWQHIAFQYNAGTVFLSVGGTVYKSSVTITTLDEAGTAFTVGSDGSNFYDGGIDELLFDANVRIEDDWPVYSDTVFQNDVEFWPFSENAGTSIYNAQILGNTLTLSGGSWVAGHRAYAAQFNGTNEYASTTLTAETFSDELLSVAVGIRFDANVACKILTQSSGINLEYTGTHIQSNIYGVSEGTTDIAPLTVDTNEWYNICITYNGSKKRCYVNGQMYGEVAATGTPSISANTLYVARDVTGANYGECTIDFIRIYRKLLCPYYRPIQVFMFGQHGFGTTEEWDYR